MPRLVATQRVGSQRNGWEVSSGGPEPTKFRCVQLVTAVGGAPSSGRSRRCYIQRPRRVPPPNIRLRILRRNVKTANRISTGLKIPANGQEKPMIATASAISAKVLQAQARTGFGRR